MRINVRSAMHISKILSDRNVAFEFADPLTLGGLLQALTAAYGEAFYEAVCSEEGYNAEKVAILLNGINVAAIGGVDISLNDGDEVTILPAIQGG